MSTSCRGGVYAVILLNVLVFGGRFAWGQVDSVDGQPRSTRREKSEFAHRDRPLDAIGLSINPVEGGHAKTPADYSRTLFPSTMDPEVGHRLPGLDIVHYWDAAELWHQPLYFDDVLLERYGQTPLPRWQPVLSGAHFFGTLPMLPYKLAIDRPMDCVSTLGYYRPGSPTPCLGRRIPRDTQAFGWEAGTWLALVFLIP
jgi:hypothetical protein